LKIYEEKLKMIGEDIMEGMKPNKEMIK